VATRPRPARPFAERLAHGALRGAAVGLSRIPRPWLLRAGGALGRTWARLGAPRTEVAAHNLAIAFPERSEAWRRELLVAAFERMGQGLVETALLPRLDAAEARRWVAIRGLEHLEAARKRSPHGGALILTAHFGSFELFAAAMALQGVPLSIVHREQRSPLLERLVVGWRERSGVEVLRRGAAARGVLRALRAGRVVAIPMDQDAPRREGAFVPFFGRPASTRVAPVRLAMRTGAPVVPGFLFRCPDGLRHEARLEPPLELEPQGESTAATEAAVRENLRRMNAALEAAIRAAPDHWAWVHRRWKTQPRELGNPYRAARRQARSQGRSPQGAGAKRARQGGARPVGEGRAEPEGERAASPRPVHPSRSPRL